ncbi:Creatinase/aminopeptidase [Rickenella mellea]|uniref:Creatinase/aminopeptidase n=1 Tax=Rickenella mellea TaxID=50990 RepID=A0A4Y7QI10_9AGAM|nr:Creatinase/aminopeptidase [Rickenella mellea]
MAQHTVSKFSGSLRLRHFSHFLIIAIPLLLFSKPIWWQSRHIFLGPPSFHHLAAHCANVPPISSSEFRQRQIALAHALHSLNASAYIAEPGPSTLFFANVSGSDWRLSERPLLLVVTPRSVDGDITAHVSIVTPAFEATRARHSLPIAADDVVFAEWEEDADPYTVAVSTLAAGSGGDGCVFVDGAVRKFIADGLADAAPKSKVLSAPLVIRQLRERKSATEIDIMRCVNEVTLLAIRSVREHMYIGIRESQVSRMMQSALTSANVVGGGCLVLFGENAALPHGGGTDRILRKTDMALFDCGGSLHGYHSDISRTIALPASTISSDHLKIWYTVHTAQKAASIAARSGAITREVDAAARHLIDKMGYGDYFTHRLGHGIGLEGHEAPYLRGGSDDIIQTGHAFSNEPGIYIEGDVGVRLEDTFYIDNDGSSVFFTEGVGGPAISPWKP